ncbi:hypothetical protein Tco_0527517 [Tanacetum coccineum]
MSAQSEGNYAEALQNYYEAMRLEIDPYDRNSEEEEPEDQGRKSQDYPLVSLVRGLVTPSKTTVNASGEEQVEDISPNTLEATKTLSKVASQKPKSIDKGRSIKVSTVSGQVSTDSEIVTFQKILMIGEKSTFYSSEWGEKIKLK